ncbi:MAG: hypothetical protein GY943_02050 [Chloroflexi bacterium]|nr:hypothetical protein [Chloroflexota bacterium]
MKQPINFVQEDLDQYADQANELYIWLDKQSTEQNEQPELTRIAIPPQLTAVISIVVASGAIIFWDGFQPNSMCWYGSCAL